MRRRLLLVAVAAVPFAVTAVAHGCSSDPPFESACQWVSDSENCFREFREDMLANGSKFNVFGDCRTPRVDAGADGSPAAPTEANADPANLPGVPNGQFLMRAMLDVCILSGGGQVVFDPPIDLSKFPPGVFADPVTYKIKFLQPSGEECGFATYTSPRGFSITLDAPPDAGAPADAAPPDAAPPVDAGDDDGGVYGPYGTYTQIQPPGRDSFDITCPTGETHHFNLLELNGPPATDGGPTSSCPGFAQLVPAASLQIYPGGIDTVGGVSFSILYPSTAGHPAGAPDLYPDPSMQQKVPAQSPDKVIYFNCAVPPAPEQCADGIKNGGETDIDCGGITVPSKTSDAGVCPPRCVMGQQCLMAADCDVMLSCVVDPKTGMRKCM